MLQLFCSYIGANKLFKKQEIFKMANVQYKSLSIPKFGWKRVAKNFMKFGWELNDATQVTTTTRTTEYSGEVRGDNIYITPHTTSSSKIHMELKLVRQRDRFSNLLAIAPLETIYNIIFLIRRLLGFLLKVAGPVWLVGLLFGSSFMTDDFRQTVMLAYMIPAFVWLFSMLIENILAFISSKILSLKSEADS